MFARFILAAVVFAGVAVPAGAARVSMWVVPWDAASLSSLQTNGGALDETNPVWYSLSAEGKIVANWNAENATWRAAMSGTDILPTIQNVVDGRFSAALVEKLIETPASRDAHAEEIRQLVITKGFDGIDIDYEALPSSLRTNFSAFINDLGKKLHESGKKLSVTVHPKTSDSQNWSGPGAQDYAALASAADSIKIMAYDYHWSTSAAGPLTPLDWLDKVATFAESTIPAKKIMMALPWYGYDWQGTSGKALFWTHADAKAQSLGITPTRDANGELTYSYADRVVFYQDAVSYQRKIELLKKKHPSITGFAHWRNGNEDPDTWKVVRALGSSDVSTALPPPTTTTPPPTTTTPPPTTTTPPPTTTTPPPTTTTPPTGSTVPQPSFTTSGPTDLAALAGKSIQAAYGIVPIDGFNSVVGVSVQAPSFPGSIALSKNTAQPGAATELVITPVRHATAGVYAAKLSFVSGTLRREMTVKITIEAVKRRRSVKK